MYEDFYDYEHSYFDEQIEEFKEGLRKTVKKEFINEMEKLKKENQELQEVKKNWNKIKADFEIKKEVYNIDKDKMKKELARMKINELLEAADIKEKCYYIDTLFGYVPWCGKCKDHKIQFLSPSGKERKEPCPDCGKYWCKNVVKEVPSLRLHFKTDPYIDCRVTYDRKEEYYGTVSYENKNIYNGTADEFDYKGYNRYHTIFTSKKLAQKICDKMNKESGVPDNLEIKENDK